MSGGGRKNREDKQKEEGKENIKNMKTKRSVSRSVQGRHVQECFCLLGNNPISTMKSPCMPHIYGSFILAARVVA